jgi:hypothetical protein
MFHPIRICAFFSSPLPAPRWFSVQIQVKKANPDAGFGELGKLLGAKWATMTDKVRDFSPTCSPSVPCVLVSLLGSPRSPHPLAPYTAPNHRRTRRSTSSRARPRRRPSKRDPCRTRSRTLMKSLTHPPIQKKRFGKTKTKKYGKGGALCVC